MITLSKIIDFLRERMEIETYILRVSPDQQIKAPSSLIDSIGDVSALFWSNEKNLDKISSLGKGTFISSAFPSGLDFFEGAIIVCENPRRAFADVVREFFVEKEKSDRIGTGNFIDEGVKIGKNVRIGHNNVILKGTCIGNNVKIGSNNTIGGVGFGYERTEDGSYELIPHIGGVVIGDWVEIGNNNCIDRAVLGNTQIGENCKIDNLIHIAHGVKIGRNSLVIANSMIAGSVTIGEDTWIAPSTSIINGCAVGSGSMTGVGSVVIRPVEEGSVVAGVPAKKLRDICAE
jgi:UDP-3-O-[3-hydroxymyristoyl] glucosamine N-acyltransferase